jgi:hypothetical protein
MTKPVKVVATIILTAVTVHFAWFEISNKLQTDKEIQLVKEQERPLTMAEMDSYQKKGEDAKRQEVAIHKGEDSPGGLRIGMSRAKALAALPGGAKDRIYPDIMRFPLPGQKGQEVIGKFIDDTLCFSKVVAIGTDAFGIDLVRRYGEPKGYNGGGR